MYIKMIKRRLVSVIFALAALMMFASCESAGKEDLYMNISPEKANEMMKNTENFVLLDVRTEEEYAEGHIPGAVLLPYTDIPVLAESVLPEKDVPVFVYCRSGRRSKIAAEELLSLGYSEIYEFGGINSWPYEIEK